MPEDKLEQILLTAKGEAISMLKAYCLYVTEQRRIAITVQSGGVSPSSEKATKIAEIIRDGCGSKWNDQTADLVTDVASILLETEIPKRYRGPRWRDLKAGTIIIPLENPNSHGYTLHVPAMFLSTGNTKAYKAGNLAEGDNLPLDYPSAMRLATQEEIDAYFKVLSDTIGIDSGRITTLVTYVRHVCYKDPDSEEIRSKCVLGLPTSAAVKLTRIKKVGKKLGELS